MNGENENKPHEITASKGGGVYTVRCGRCGNESDHYVRASACCPTPGCGVVMCVGVLVDLAERKLAAAREHDHIWQGGR